MKKSDYVVVTPHDDGCQGKWDPADVLAPIFETFSGATWMMIDCTEIETCSGRLRMPASAVAEDVLSDAPSGLAH